MDGQVVELLGRNRLVSELLRAGLEVALPMRDRGVDLIAYADQGSRVKQFVGRPIQMKAASASSFSVHGKYEPFPNLILAYVWYLDDPARTVTYALTYPEAYSVAEQMGWIHTPSWQSGGYSTTKPSVRLVTLLEPHRMTSERWWQKITADQLLPIPEPA